MFGRKGLNIVGCEVINTPYMDLVRSRLFRIDGWRLGVVSYACDGGLFDFLKIHQV